MNKFITNKISDLAKFNEDFANLILNLNAETDNEICARISTFDNLEARVLSLANSEIFTSLGSKNETKTISQLLQNYGKSQLLAFILYEYFEKILTTILPSYGILGDDFKRISLSRSALIFQWLKEQDKSEYEFLPSAAILLEFGRVLIDDMLRSIGKNDKFYEEIKKCEYGADLADVECEFCGCHRGSVDEALFSYFGLSDISILIKFSNSIDDAALEIKEQCAMLKVVKTVIDTHRAFDENSMENTLNLLDELMFEQGAFFKAAKKVAL